MRTTVDIDDRLMAAALRASGRRTKKAAIEDALRLLVRTRSQGRMRALRGMSRRDGAPDETGRDG